MSDFKTCEEYVLNRLERLEVEVDVWKHQRELDVKAYHDMQQKYLAATEAMAEVQKLFDIRIMKTSRCDDDYYIFAKNLYDRSDRKAFERIREIFGLEYEEDEEE